MDSRGGIVYIVIRGLLGCLYLRLLGAFSDGRAKIPWGHSGYGSGIVRFDFVFLLHIDLMKHLASLYIYLSISSHIYAYYAQFRMNGPSIYI